MGNGRKFASYVIPSVLSFALTGIYCFVDALFVGNKVGDVGLAAINISFCLISLLQAVGSGIGLGASVRYSILKAQNRDGESLDYIGGSFLLMTVVGLAISLPMILFPRTLLIAIGASPYIAELGRPYLLIQAYGALIQVFATGMVPIARNNRGANLAMTAVVLGCIFNMVFDWVFVWLFDWGLPGASAATLVGQAISLILLWAFLQRRHLVRFTISRDSRISLVFKDIARIGFTPFGLIMIPNLSIIILNKATLAYGGETGLAAYGCIAYLTYIVLLVMQGVGDGAQPLLSTCYGSQDIRSLRSVTRMTYLWTMAIALISFTFEWLFRYQLGPFMGAEKATAAIVAFALPVFCLGFPFQAISRSAASVLYATESSLRSYLITYSEPVFTLASVLVLCPRFGLNGVWISCTAAQVLVMLLAVAVSIKKKKK